MSEFKKELENLINRFSKESGSDTPDFILANYLDNCLKNFDETIQQRKNYYSEDIGIIVPSETTTEAVQEPTPDVVVDNKPKPTLENPKGHPWFNGTSWGVN